jgi:hypothetical protein
MTQQQLKLIQSAMKMAAKKGFNPYDSNPAQDRCYTVLAKMNQGKHTCTRSEADANRYMGVR